MPISENRQYRNMQVMQVSEQSAAEKLIQSEMYVEGYAMTFSRYKLFGEGDEAVYEQFDPNCFDNCDFSDVILQYDHNGHVFARTSNGSLKLAVDEHGLKIGADLSRTDGAKQLFTEISTRMCPKMSFTFAVGDYDYDPQSRTITHHTVSKVYDVSAVSIPANDGTEIFARRFFDGEIEKVKQELAKRAKAKINLKLKLEGF